MQLNSTSIADRARRRIMRRLMPYLFGLFVIAYLDRVNVSYAALQMKSELSFTDEVLGFGAGVFFWGYFLLEIPGSILVEKWSARKWIARIMISWGMIAILTGFIHTATQFYWIRFSLGVAEAGFFPGIVVYLSHWFRSEERARALALLVIAQPIANVIGSPLSGLLLGVTWLGLPGWRWLFIIEGIPAVIFGVVTIFYLTDWPHQARWLPDDERRWITLELDRERREKESTRRRSAWQALRQREVIVLTASYLCINASIYGFTFWLPTMLKALSGSSNRAVTLVAALPYCVGVLAALVVGWSSDRTRERHWHTATCMALIAVGLALGVAARNQLPLAVAMFCVPGLGMDGYPPAFWSLPSSFLSRTAAAASIGLINSVGNLGGFAGPYAMGYLTKVTQTYVAGVLCFALFAAIGAGLVLSVRSMSVKRAAAEAVR